MNSSTSAAQVRPGADGCPHSFWRRDTALLLYVAAATVAVHWLAASRGYGFHRDGLATLDDARHLAWGYVASPPVTPFFARVSLILFGTSLPGFRFFAAVAQAITLVLTGLMARDLGGSRGAQLLAAAAAKLRFRVGDFKSFPAKPPPRLLASVLAQSKGNGIVPILGEYQLHSHKVASEEDSLVEVAERNGISLAILRRGARTLGAVIVDPASSDLIEGVQIEPLRVFPDDRGFFTELARLGKGIAEHMAPAANADVQISATVSYPGTIKAIHYHFEQTDLWAPVEGMIQVFLYDLRRNSRTFGHINTLYAGRYRPWSILIPPGVGHGYKVIGTDPAVLVYMTDRHYNPHDEGRLAWDHAAIAYDWETQHK